MSVVQHLLEIVPGNELTMTVEPGDREPRSMAIDQQDRQALPSGRSKQHGLLSEWKDRPRCVSMEGIGFVPTNEGIGCMPMNGTTRWKRSNRLRQVDAKGLKEGIGFVPMDGMCRCG